MFKHFLTNFCVLFPKKKKSLKQKYIMKMQHNVQAFFNKFLCSFPKKKKKSLKQSWDLYQQQQVTQSRNKKKKKKKKKREQWVIWDEPFWYLSFDKFWGGTVVLVLLQSAIIICFLWLPHAVTHVSTPYLVLFLLCSPFWLCHLIVYTQHWFESDHFWMAIVFFSFSLATVGVCLSLFLAQNSVLLWLWIRFFSSTFVLSLSLSLSLSVCLSVCLSLSLFLSFSLSLSLSLSRTGWKIRPRPKTVIL